MTRPQKIHTILRHALPVCATLAASSALAQTARVSPPANPPAGEVVSLSSFEVTTTQGSGYVATNAATGFKTNQALLDLPQPMLVVTRDLIEDIGYIASSDILRYAGVANFFRGESLAVRGTRINNALVDEVPDSAPYMDNVFIDSYEVIKGPAAVLYATASLGGVVLKTTKKPLTQAQYSVTGRIDEHGLYRGELDLTGPIGELGAGTVSYRVVAAHQDGDTFFKRLSDERTSVHPSLQFTTGQTTVRLAFDLQTMVLPPNANNILTPEGKLYTGAGRDEAYFARDGMEDFERTAGRVTLLHSFSPNWDMKIQGVYQNYNRLGGVVFPAGGVDWINRTMTFTARRNYSDFELWLVQADFNGKYTIGGLPNQSTFGFYSSDERNRSAFAASAAFGRVTVPIDNPQMENIRTPQPNEYVSHRETGNKNNQYRDHLYYQHTLEVLPDRLTLVGGVAWSQIQSSTISNIAIRPHKADVTSSDDYLHRIGLVYKVTDDVSVYALESTTFTPNTARDINNVLLPVQEGKGQEIGVKTALLGGRISSTFSLFKIELSNQATFAGVDDTGRSYFVPIGSTTQEGFDFDLSISPLPGLQVVATGFWGDVKNQAGDPVANSYDQLLSLFARYDFTEGRWNGLSIGGGASRISGRLVGSGGLTLPPGQQRPFIELDDGVLTNLFASYRRGPWTFRVNVENLLDKAFPMGAQTGWLVDPSPPRTFSFSTTYRF